VRLSLARPGLSRGGPQAVWLLPPPYCPWNSCSAQILCRSDITALNNCDAFMVYQSLTDREPDGYSDRPRMVPSGKNKRTLISFRSAFNSHRANSPYELLSKLRAKLPRQTFGHVTRHRSRSAIIRMYGALVPAAILPSPHRLLALQYPSTTTARTSARTLGPPSPTNILFVRLVFNCERATMLVARGFRSQL